jgi:hypothetical protein
MKLKDLQKQFSAFLYGNQTSKDELTSSLIDSAPVDIKSGLAVYAGNFIYSIVDALKATYPVIEKILTEPNFKYFCREYIYANPSTNPDLTTFGKSFSRFLAQRTELTDQSWLEDIGKLEWSWERLDAGFGDFSNKQLIPSLSLLELNHEVLDLWANPSDFISNPSLPLARKQYLVLWTENGINYAEEIGLEMHSFITQFAFNEPMGADGPSKNEIETKLLHLIQKNWARA